MNKEDKELLLQDICARMLYDVAFKTDIVNSRVAYCTLRQIFKADNGVICVELIDRDIDDNPLASTSIFEMDLVVPYLRSMSSMTEEEEKEFNVITNGEKGFQEDEDGWIRCDNIHTKWGVWPKGCAELLAWLNAHYFDYRGLIDKGLAVEAPEGMYEFIEE